ncbi:putative monodehydroascorbate reductase (NADH) [Rosa chinensis]|uniref:Putative monodehydroascorbate reductase (NADH) n=1 Tax=Rosa chinensis TaxID=74649 RepID=A0A2P6P2P7_ROSCH|nr:thioredoxin-like 1-2, chloroplastic [Rosa chinensis]PRQ16206.1 putative monodehydroascorbate reductase (NADH) [Rosa chinensis]
MAISSKCGLYISGVNEMSLRSKFTESNSRAFPVLGVVFWGKPISDHKGLKNLRVKAPRNFSVHAQASICVSKAMKWWEKTLKPNMVEIHSAQELIDSLHNAGDRLVVVDFYSPGCGGCRALHPKICQLAEQNPDAIFLKVNYEELKTMCHGLHIHVLPFFRFYRGAEGRVCSFSCTNATIKKFKDALAKYGAEGCSPGPAKGLDESEILHLAEIGEISARSSPPSTKEERVEEDLVMKSIDLSGVWSNVIHNHGVELEEEESALLKV